MCVWTIAGYLVRLSLLSRLLWSSQTALVYWYCFSFLYSSMIIPDFFPVCNYKRFPRTQKSHNVYFWGSIRSYFFPPFNAFHDWLYLTECLCGLLNWIAGFMVSMAMLHCHKCSWVVNALFGHIHNFFHLYHLNRDKSN